MTGQDSHDDDELELEPVDPEILEMQRERGRDKVRRAEESVDINQVYDDQQTSDPLTWDDFQGFRFTTRHLLIATAILAVFLTLVRNNVCLGTLLSVTAAVAAGWFFVLRKERRLKLQRQQQREATQAGEEVDYSEFDAADERPARPEFRFAFSMKELFAAFTIAAIVLGLVSALEAAPLVLGVVALSGLVVHVLGFDPPPVVILGWWVLLVLYIAMSLLKAFTSSGVAWHSAEFLCDSLFC